MPDSPEEAGLALSAEKDGSAWQKYVLLMQRARQEFPDVFGINSVVAEADARERIFSCDESGNQQRWQIFARKAGVPVGMISAYRALEDDQDVQNRAAVTDLYVVPECRGVGMGKSLLKSMLRTLQTDGSFTVVELIVSRAQTDAIRMYEECGFVKTGDSHLSRHHEIVMEKKI